MCLRVNVRGYVCTSVCVCVVRMCVVRVYVKAHLCGPQGVFTRILFALFVLQLIFDTSQVLSLGNSPPPSKVDWVMSSPDEREKTLDLP